MSILPTDRILAQRPGDPTTILNRLDTPDDTDKTYVRSMVTWCKAAGIDPFIALTQAAVETDNFRSSRWVQDGNAAGIGIPADSTVQPFEIANGDEAARIHVQTLYSAVTKRLHPDVPVPVAAQPWFDGVWLPKVHHPNYPGVTTVDDLNTRYQVGKDAHATWAWDAAYVSTLINRGGVMYPDLQPQSSFTPADEKPQGGTNVSIVYGNVPYPDVYVSHFPTSSPWIGSGAPAVLEAVVWHRMVGTWAGSNSWGQAGNFATAYGVSVKATDGTGGKIYEWIARNNGLYGESSGPVNAPYGDGLALVNKVGVSSVNRTTKAIEISGNYDTPLDAEAKHAVAALTAYFADQKHIPWNQFPAIPGENRSFVVWHQEITIGTGKVCPGQVVMDATPEMIQMTAAIMKQYQETGGTAPAPDPKPEPAPTPKPSKYATPIIYPWLESEDGKVHKVGSTRVLPLTVTYTATRSTPRYQTGNKKGSKIGPNIAKGTQFEANRVFRSADGVTFVMTRYGARVAASALTPRVGVTASGRISVRHEEGGEPDVISDNVETAP